MFLLAVNPTLKNEELLQGMQDKVIALQDHEISFLNDTIANIWAAVGIGAGIIVGIAGFVGWLINRSNQKAKEKMQLAEQILGDAQVAKEELLQYKADLEVYREKTRKEFSELISLVNSEEIANLKNNITILSITSQIRNKYEEGRRIMDAYWEDYRRLQRNHEFDLTEGYEECTASAIAIASKLKEPLANLTEANELLDETIKWKKRVEKAISEVRFEAEPFFIDEYMKDFGEKVKLQEKIDSLQEKIDSLAE